MHIPSSARLGGTPALWRGRFWFADGWAQKTTAPAKPHASTPDSARRKMSICCRRRRGSRPDERNHRPEPEIILKKSLRTRDQIRAYVINEMNEEKRGRALRRPAQRR